MAFKFEFSHLLAYTDWDRAQWEAWFRTQGTAPFAVGLGPNGDGRVNNVGEMVRHIFGAEQRYADRIRGVAPSDVGAVPTDDVDALFDLGRRSRQAMRALLAELDEKRWDVPQEIQLGSNKRSVTPKTMAAQSVTHEIRHWAQTAAFLRMAGYKTGPHDFLVSPVFEAGPASAR